MAYLEASDAGIRAYEKAGFKAVGKMGFDASPWGCQGKFPVDTVSKTVMWPS